MAVILVQSLKYDCDEEGSSKLMIIMEVGVKMNERDVISFYTFDDRMLLLC